MVNYNMYQVTVVGDICTIFLKESSDFLVVLYGTNLLVFISTIGKLEWLSLFFIVLRYIFIRDLLGSLEIIVLYS